MTFNDAIDINLLDRFLTNLKNLFARKTEVPTATSDLVNDSVLLPNFDNLTPIKTIEFDKNTSAYSKLFTRANSGISATMSEVVDVVLFRITVTGTNIYSRSDVIVKFQPGLVNPQVYAFHHTYSTTAATTGIYILRFNYPKVLNNDIPWMVDFNQNNTTVRHYKIEVFADTENIEWVDELTPTTYNSTNYNSANISVYYNRGLLWLGTQSVAVSSASSAAYINSYLPKYVTGTPIRAGEALVSTNIVFISNGFAYNISNKEMPIDPDYDLCVIGTAFAADATIGYAYFRSIWSFRYTNSFTGTRDTFVQGDKVYLRCNLVDGKIYSDDHLAKEITPGYTWYLLGSIYNATNDLALCTTGSMFLTLDSTGCISHINGRPTQAALLFDGTYDESTFIKRDSNDETAEIKTIRGNTIVWNQLASDGYNRDFSCTNSGTSVSYPYICTNPNIIVPEFVKDHVYYYNLKLDFTSEDTVDKLYFTKYQFTDFIEGSHIVKPTSIAQTGSDILRIKGQPGGTTVSGKVSFMLYDLTRIFGKGNEPADTKEVERLFTDDYYEHEEGNLVSLTMTGLKSTKVNGDTLSNLSLNVTTITGKADGSNESVAIFPNGMNGINGIQDEIDFESGKAIKRFSSYNLGELTWNYVSSSQNFTASFTGIKNFASNVIANIYSKLYITDTADNVYQKKENKTIGIGSTTLRVYDATYSDAATFKTALSGVMLIYELAEPIEYTLDTIPNTSYKTEEGGKEIILPNTVCSVDTAPATLRIHYGTNIVKLIQELEEGVVFAGDDDGQGVIAGGGDVNVIETVKVNGTALTPDANKAVNVVVPTTLSGLASDTTHRTVTDTEKSTWNGKQDALVSGTNIKTINNESILGNGNITIQGGSGGSGDENVIEIVKVNGTALTPDANKAVNIDLTVKADLNGSSSQFFTASSLDVFDDGESCGISAIYTDDKVTLQFTDSVEGNTLSYTFNPGESERIIATTDDIPAAPGTLNTTATTAQSTSSSEALSGNVILHKVAKTGTYNDLIGKPTIPSAVTESTVSGWGFTKNTGTVSSLSDLGITATATELNYTDGVTSNIQTQLNAKGTYSKPSGGIPASDLASGVIPTVPTNVSAFTNDAGYLTSASIVTIYSGSTAPSSSLGNNGDIYIQTS